MRVSWLVSVESAVRLIGNGRGVPPQWRVGAARLAETISARDDTRVSPRARRDGSPWRRQPACAAQAARHCRLGGLTVKTLRMGCAAMLLAVGALSACSTPPATPEGAAIQVNQVGFVP